MERWIDGHDNKDSEDSEDDSGHVRGGMTSEDEDVVGGGDSFGIHRRALDLCASTMY